MTDPADLERSLRLAEQREVQARQDAKNLQVQNRHLQETLAVARDRLTEARRQLESLANPPLTIATIVGLDELDHGVVDVTFSGRLLRVSISTEIHRDRLDVGSRLLLNDSLVALKLLPQASTGDSATLVERLDDDTALLDSTGGESPIVRLSASLMAAGPRAGDTLLVDRRAGIAWAKVVREDAGLLALEEVPDVTWDDIGGLATQIAQVRDAVETPFLHRDLYRQYGVRAPKGVLLYGPPGTGKTMIAKAVAASLASRMSGPGTSYFLNVKGPELLTKYVGETERQIRTIFARARERATEGCPVIVFFDEMESLFRTRGSGISSDVESTIVPQLLSEIDGVEGLDNVIIIGASNREDLIDPAILRPGRLDVKIRLDRPDALAAAQIMAKHLTSETPVSGTTVSELIEAAVADAYSEAYPFLEITYASGRTQTLYFRDFLSGAMLANIVDRAKKAAIRREIQSGARGVDHGLMHDAVREEFEQNEDLPNTTNPDEWARLWGNRGERVVGLHPLRS